MRWLRLPRLAQNAKMAECRKHMAERHGDQVLEITRDDHHPPLVVVSYLAHQAFSHIERDRFAISQACFS